MRKNPYTALMERASEFARSVKYAHRKVMWSYPSDKLDTGWSLGKLKERVIAADQLGYDVRLEIAQGGSIEVVYIKRVIIPYEFLN